MSLTQQPQVNVLNGGLGQAWNNGKPAGDNELIPSIPDNALDNPTFDVSESSAPNGATFNGVVEWGGKWGHYGQLYVSSGDAKTFTGNAYLANFPAFKDLGYSNLGDSPKVISLYGSGTNFPTVTGDQANDDNTRTYTEFNLQGMSSVAGAQTYPSANAWTRHEWSQSVNVPSDATKATFGAYLRVPETDELRALNNGGLYLWQDTAASPPTDVYVNVICARVDGQTYTFVTGAQTQGISSQTQWSGLNNTIASGEYGFRWNDDVDIQSVDYVNTSTLRQFRRVEKEVTLQGSGSGRKVGLSMFFGENQSYLNASGTPSGAIQFYNPFVQFFDSSGNIIIPITEATLVLKHTGYGSARITIGGTTLNYDGTEGTNFPDPITSTDAFTATFRAIGVDAIFDGDPSITGGTYTGSIDESTEADLQITWDGISSEIVITTDALKD